MSLDILIGADLVPTISNHDYFSTADIEYLFGSELVGILKEHDFRVFNLETPLTDVTSPIEKSGLNFSAPVSTIKGIKALNPSLLCLANNHILDQGEQGILSTISLLNINSIPYVGAGKNLTEASTPYIFTENGVKLGVYACAEHEFSIASETRAGANPFDQLESPDHIFDLKNKCDYVIVLYHGGKEYYRYPSPYLQKCCRKIAEKGADFIVCQHSHSIGCYEDYNGSTIVYGQGDFLFDMSKNEFRKTALLISIKLSNNKSAVVNHIPVIKCNNQVRLADDVQAGEIMSSFISRSQNILTEGFVESEYLTFAESKHVSYIKALHGNNLTFKAINKLTKNKLINLLYSRKALVKILNYIECESHRELIAASIKNRLNNKNETPLKNP